MAEKKENRYSQILALIFESGFTENAELTPSWPRSRLIV